jgi:hypothetical protein
MSAEFFLAEQAKWTAMALSQLDISFTSAPKTRGQPL